jgi:MoaA/NifB/PqqE/SkfB family radical SAM enzyme
MDVIWNLTKACPWDCDICSVSAIHVCNTTAESIYLEQKNKKEELTLADKLLVLKLLVERGFQIDFSGGDPLYYDEDFRIIEQAVRWLPSSKIDVSMTGAKITESKLRLLKGVHIVEFTLDNLTDRENPFRPRGYNSASMLAINKCVDAGVNVRGVTVLYPFTLSKGNLEDIYEWLCENGASEWELLRFYPIGRAARFLDLIPKTEDYLETMQFLRTLKGSTKIFFQHSLNILEGTKKCPALKESIGILPGGEVVLCPWAMNVRTKPFKEFDLGRLPEDNLDDIIDKARKKLEHLDTEKCCRTIAYIKNKERS